MGKCRFNLGVPPVALLPFLAVPLVLVWAGCSDGIGLTMNGDVVAEAGTADAADESPDVSAPETADVDVLAVDDSRDGEGLTDVVTDVTDTDTDTDTDTGPPPGPWRSVLYPDNWSPGSGPSDALRIHDFSYAGYRNGESPPGPAPDAPTFDVTNYGADPTGLEDATLAIQDTIDAASAASGGIVLLPAGLFRVDGNLRVGTSNIVLEGAGSQATKLHFTASTGLPQKHHIVFKGQLGAGIESPLVADGLVFQDTLELADAAGFVVGDDVAVGWVITPQFVAAHQMEALWKVFNDQWQPFFRRTLVAVDTESTPHTVTLDVPLRYDANVSDGASLRQELGLLQEVGLGGIGIANAVGWEEAWAATQVHAVSMAAVKDAWIDDLVSFPSPGAPTLGKGAGAHLQSGGVIIRDSKRVTVSNSDLRQAQNRGPGGNGYLFEVGASSEILFRDCVGRAGRHNFIQNWGFGASGIVWLRVVTSDGKAETSSTTSAGGIGHSEFHHSLAMANLIDSCVIDDGWSAVNRKYWSSGAGATATGSVFWNSTGNGTLRSYQHGMGFVVGTGPDLMVQVVPPPPLEGLDQATWDSLGAWELATPDDWLEGVNRAADLVPSSLYEDQLARRLQP